MSYMKRLPKCPCSKKPPLHQKNTVCAPMVKLQGTLLSKLHGKVITCKARKLCSLVKLTFCIDSCYWWYLCLDRRSYSSQNLQRSYRGRISKTSKLGLFVKLVNWLVAVKYFLEKLHLRRFAGFLLQFWARLGVKYLF